MRSRVLAIYKAFVCLDNDDQSSGASVIGNSSGWHQAAKMFEDSIDFNVNPCDEFYDYACGKWRTNPIHQVSSNVHVKLACIHLCM